MDADLHTARWMAAAQARGAANLDSMVRYARYGTLLSLVPVIAASFTGDGITLAIGAVSSAVLLSRCSEHEMRCKFAHAEYTELVHILLNQVGDARSVHVACIAVVRRIEEAHPMFDDSGTFKLPDLPESRCSTPDTRSSTPVLVETDDAK